MRVIGRVLRFCRKRRGGKFAPPSPPVPTPQFRAKMTEIERGVDRITLGQHRADWIAEKADIDNVPTGAAARQFEQTLARPDIKPLRHAFPLNCPSESTARQGLKH